MNKKTWVIVAALLMALTGSSLAATFDYFQMVGASDVGNAAVSKTDVRTTYNLNNLLDIPTLYYHVDSPVTSNVITFWVSPLHSSTMVPDTVSASDNEGWLSLSNWNTLSNQEKLGTWRVAGFLKENGRLLDCKLTSFTVTPEPMAMVLYGMGGLPLAAHFLRRRKQIVA